jgi:uncharacterized protein (DUF433 family)
VRGTSSRISVELVSVELLEAGWSHAQILASYPLSEEDIAHAVLPFVEEKKL